jgi:hypothetical protein
VKLVALVAVPPGVVITILPVFAPASLRASLLGTSNHFVHVLSISCPYCIHVGVVGGRKVKSFGAGAIHEHKSFGAGAIHELSGDRVTRLKQFIVTE